MDICMTGRLATLAHPLAGVVVSHGDVDAVRAVVDFLRIETCLGGCKQDCGQLSVVAAPYVGDTIVCHVPHPSLVLRTKVRMRNVS